MNFVVAYDGRELSKAALARGAALAEGVDGRVLAVTIVPEKNGDYARERGWLDEDAAWDEDAVVEALTDSVADIAPTAAFTYRLVDKYAPRGTIGHALRTMATEEDIDVLVVGSENAGRVVTVLSSIAQSVAYGSYDLYIVRHPHETID